MIKTAISLDYPLITPELIRLLQKHPDVEILWIERSKNTEYENDFFETLQDEVNEIPIIETATDSDFEDVDLYIGKPKAYLPEKENLKLIFTEPTDAVTGVCEYNRKAMVRGASKVYSPDISTILCALALMPLAKNLMLNSSVSATLLLPVDRHASRSAFSLSAKGLNQESIQDLHDKILSELQTSFNSPIVGNIIESTVSSFACAIFTLDIKISADQALVLFKDFYSDHRHIYFPQKSISERMVLGTNKSVITLHNDSVGHLVVSVACDALFKGGAGNILHILNLLFGLDERTGF